MSDGSERYAVAVSFGSSPGRAAVAEVHGAHHAQYLVLHDCFGRGANDVMRRLKVRKRAIAEGRRS